MASGFKVSMPEVIFVIHEAGEARYYTTADTFAQGLIDTGEHGQIEVFFPSGMVDDSIAQKMQRLNGFKTPTWLFNPPRPVDRFATTKAENAAKRSWLERKREYKAGLLAMIKDAVGSTP